MLEIIYLKHKLQSTKHLVSLDAFNIFIATTITEAFSEFIKFKYFQLLVTSISPKLIYFMQSLPYLTLKGIVISFMQLNEVVRYSLLHKCIIHTTLLFNRAFLAVNWSWLSYIHNKLWDGSWIVINSSFQSLVIHNITCTHLTAFMQYITTFSLYLCNQSLTPFIWIHSMHDYKIHKIFLMHIHSCYLALIQEYYAFNIPCMA